MTFKNNVTIIFVVLTTIFSLPAFTQQSGTYVIPTELQGTITPAMLDSFRLELASKPKTDTLINYDSLGNFVWFGGAAEDGLQYSTSFPNKAKVITFTCFENGWVKSEAQFDTLNNTKDYDTHTACYNESGNDLWTETITISVLSTDTLVINSPVDVTARIYDAYTIAPSITELSVVGNSTNQSFLVDLENNSYYIVVFINDETDIVNIQRIGG
jgi:hypothetical protein